MTDKKPCRLAVLLSGTGSTMVNLCEHIESGNLCAEIEVVVSSRSKAPGLKKAEKRGIPTRVLPRNSFAKKGAFDADAFSRALAELIAPFEPDLVVMAGFMTRLTAGILDKYDVVNVHPALLPMFGGAGFYGHHVHEAVLRSGAKVTGATVHFADDRYDHGPIIMQEEIPILDGDTPESLARRVQAVERRIYPKALALYASGELKPRGRRGKTLKDEEKM